jgi:hypothetical protein
VLSVETILDARGRALAMGSRLIVRYGQEILDGIPFLLLLDPVEANSAVARHVPRLTVVRPVHRDDQEQRSLAVRLRLLDFSDMFLDYSISFGISNRGKFKNSFVAFFFYHFSLAPFGKITRQ